MSAPTYISGEEVCSLVSTAELMGAIEPAFKWFSTGEGVEQPIRNHIPVPEHSGVLLSMPGYCAGANSLAVKAVTLYPDNMDNFGLPSVHGIVLLFDPTTGIMKAIIEGISVTNLRTAAASAVAMKVLMPRAAASLCIVGSGVQARSHLKALTDAHSYSRVVIWGRNKSKAEAAVADAGVAGVEVIDSLEEAVRDADVIATTTMPTEPVLFGRMCKPGAVICSMGASRPDRRELDDELIHNSVVVVDSREGATKESGDIILSKAEIFAEVGEIIAGLKTIPKVPDCGKKFILFKSLGMAVEDVVTAKLIYDKYLLKHNKP